MLDNVSDGLGPRRGHPRLLPVHRDQISTRRQLFLFGFSRGAFTARCLAAVICKYGIVELAAEADPERTIRRIYSEGYRGRFSPTRWDTRKLPAKHDVRQVWFPGVHCDVGGGYKERGLSDGALKWMMDESEQAGVVYRPDALKQLSPDPCDVLHDSHTGS